MHRKEMSSIFPIAKVFAIASASLAFLISTGCASAPGKDNKSTSRTSQKGKVSKEGEKITMDKLDQLTYGFADRYMAYIVSACDEIEKSGATPQQRRLAYQVNLTQISSIYDSGTCSLSGG